MFEQLRLSCCMTGVEMPSEQRNAMSPAPREEKRHLCDFL